MVRREEGVRVFSESGSGLDFASGAKKVNWPDPKRAIMRKKKQNTTYSMGIIGLPTVIIAILWISLWLLWPSIETTSSPNRQLAATKIFFIPFDAQNGNMELTNPLDKAPEVTDKGNEEPSRSLVNYWAPRDQRLDRTVEPNIDSPSTIPGFPAATLSVPDGTHQANFKTQPLFKKNGTGKTRILLEMSATLKDFGFEIPHIPLADIKDQDKSWQVAATVHVAENGRPSHVFLESGCGNPDIDKLVVRTIYQGKILKSTASCKGLVTVSYGKE